MPNESYFYGFYRRKVLETPLCRRCAKNPVGIRCGKAMKTCASCLRRLRKYQRDNFRRRAIETNSVICSTCNKRPAMIKGSKQYRTCRECSNRKKSAYYEDRERSRNAIKFYNLAMQHFDALPPEIVSPMLKQDE